MAGDERESEWTLGVGDGQGGLVCYDSRGCKESYTTEWLNNNKMSQDPLVTSSFGKTCDIVVQFFQWPLEGTISWFTASPHKDDLDYVLKSEHLKKKKKTNHGHHFVHKGPYSQSYSFSSSHVRMWELDHKEGWAQKNWCFWTVVLKNTLESLLDVRSNQSILKKINPNIH